MQEATGPSGLVITITLLVGVTLGAVGAFYTGRALYRSRANDVFTLCVAFFVFCLRFSLPMLFIVSGSPTKPGEREFDRFIAAKRQADYWGERMMKQTRAGDIGMAQDSAAR